MQALESSLIYDEPLFKITGKVIVILSGKWSDLSESESTLLSKILGSIGLSLDGAIVLSSPVDIKNAVELHSPAAIIRFGPNSQSDGVKYTPGQLGGVPFLLADEPSELTEERKKALWNALKQMFQV